MQYLTHICDLHGNAMRKRKVQSLVHIKYLLHPLIYNYNHPCIPYSPCRRNLFSPQVSQSFLTQEHTSLALCLKVSFLLHQRTSVHLGHCPSDSGLCFFLLKKQFLPCQISMFCPLCLSHSSDQLMLDGLTTQCKTHASFVFRSSMKGCPFLSISPLVYQTLY